MSSKAESWYSGRTVHPESQKCMKARMASVALRTGGIHIENVERFPAQLVEREGGHFRRPPIQRFRSDEYLERCSLPLGPRLVWPLEDRLDRSTSSLLRRQFGVWQSFRIARRKSQG